MEVFISRRQLVFMAQRSATRIMRRRLRPSSLGVRLRGCGGKKMEYAALHLRTKSDSGVTYSDADETGYVKVDTPVDPFRTPASLLVPRFTMKSSGAPSPDFLHR